jgi:hypothetical protein
VNLAGVFEEYFGTEYKQTPMIANGLESIPAIIAKRGNDFRYQPGVDTAEGDLVMEGGRTTAAIAASRHGHVLKMSEHEIVSSHTASRQVWEL